MASIPLPELNIRPPQQQANPLEEYGRLMQMQSLMQNQQLQRQEIQLRQQQINDQQTMQKLAQSGKYVKKDSQGNVTGFDYDTFSTDAAKSGVSFQAMNQLQTMRKNAVDTNYIQAQTDEKHIANQVSIQKQAYERLEGVRNESDSAARQQKYGEALQWAGQNGIDTRQFPQQVGDDKFLNGIESAIGMTTQHLADAKTQQETATSAQQEKTSATEQAAKQAQMEFYKRNPQLGAPGVPAETVQMAGAPVPPAQFSAWKAGQEAQARAPFETQTAVNTEVAKQRALASPLSQIQSTTRAGRNYINREDIPQGSGGYTEQQAAQARIPVVDKDTAGVLKDIDTSRANQDYMLNTISKKLASGPLSRPGIAARNTIEKLAQTDPELAAMGTYRNAAIQSMRAVAGSKGLRINQYEVQLAIDNDIPKMTDTLPVAQQKLKNLNAFLENAEQAHLVRNRQNMTAPQPQTQQAPKALPLSAIQQAAKDHGVSVEEATRQAKAAGYTVQ